MSSKAPIFIGGLYKSGTTLLRAMLGQHSAIASGLETYWFDIDWSNQGSEEFLGRIGLLREFYGIDGDVMDGFIRSSSNTVEFLNHLLGHYTAVQGKRRWAEKTPGNICHIEDIRLGWPDAKIIHIRRDPRDVFASLKQARKWDTVQEFTGHWCRMIGDAESAKSELHLDRDCFLEVRYEDLVLQPDLNMRKVMEFVGENWEQAVADFRGKGDDFYTVRKSTGKASTTLERLQQPLSRQRVGIWKEVVDAAELDQIRKVVETKGLLKVFDRMTAEVLPE
jgi:hypothetical protein